MSQTISCSTHVVISSSQLTSYRENYYRPDVLHTYTVFNGYTYHYCSYLINLGKIWELHALYDSYFFIILAIMELVKVDSIN